MFESCGEVGGLAKRERFRNGHDDGPRLQRVVQERLAAAQSIGDGPVRSDTKNRVRQFRERDGMPRCGQVEDDAIERERGARAAFGEREKVMHHPEFVEGGTRVEESCERA